MTRQSLAIRMIDVYIARHVVAGALVSLLALVVLFAFIAFVDDLDNVGKGDYTVRGAIEYVVLTMPRRAFNLFPLAALIGALMGLGQLAATSELIVIRSAGVSVARIVAAVLGAALVLILIAMVIGELVAPAAERLAQSRRSVAISNELKTNTRFGFWVRDGNSFIKVRKVLPDNRLQSVFIYEFDDQRRLRVATRAAGATFRDDRWVLEKVRQSRIDDDAVVSSSHDKATWDANFQPDLVQVVTVRPESLSALGLSRYIHYLRDNGLDTARFELALWHKFSYPLASAVMLFLAIPMVLGRLKSTGIGQRVVVGVVVGIAFHVLNQAASQIGLVYGVNAAVSATAPMMLFLAAGTVMMRRLR